MLKIVYNKVSYIKNRSLCVLMKAQEKGKIMAVQAVNNVQNKKAVKIGKTIGTAAGFSGYLINVAKKEGIKDTFISAGKEAVEKGLSSNVGIGIKAGSILLVASAFAIGGRIIGGLIGKVVDKHNAKKAEKAE